MKVDNLDNFDGYRTFRNCVVITIPGQAGFLWIEPNGEIHNPGMNINVDRADVQVLFDSETGRMSAGGVPS